MSENFANFFATTLDGGISDTDTLLTVASAVGAPTADFRLLIQDAENDSTNRELVLVSAVSGEDFTVTRGIEGTTAVAHGTGSFVAHVVTAGGLLQGIYDRVTNVVATVLVTFESVAASHQTDVALDFACQIESWQLFADASGNAVIDVWKDTYANFPPTDADSITGSSPPTLSGSAKAEDTDLSDWDGAISPGDVLRFNVDSVSGINRLVLALKVTRA